MSDAEQSWPEAVYRELVRADVRQVGYVPDSGLSRLIVLCHAGETTTAVMIVTMRGQPGEKNPWQLPMGGITADVLGLAEVAVRQAATADSIAGYVAEAARAAFDGPAAAAVLIAQAVVGVKAFED